MMILSIKETVQLSIYSLYLQNKFHFFGISLFSKNKVQYELWSDGEMIAWMHLEQELSQLRFSRSSFPMIWVKTLNVIRINYIQIPSLEGPKEEIIFIRWENA